MRICGRAIGVVVSCADVASTGGTVGTSILLYVRTQGGTLCLVGLTTFRLKFHNIIAGLLKPQAEFYEEH